MKMEYIQIYSMKRGRDHYGILVGENTEYCIGLSTEGSFVY